ncbi:MAG: FHA domain-containing protein [Actinomyces sp.]|nr:FHA domain-containing protein [Actinomyces sp.]MDN6428686.1 FHA domain-containing protein [Propionibacterium sp.]MDN6566578.1 FHA domain-containing protein [Actinomyces sp.]MDN6794685.1 FHA domain-containing protein [Propionibacterium sp.]
MTSDLAFTVFRIGYLVLLWAMVFGAVSILRRDIFGTVVTPRGKGRRQADKERRKSRRRRRTGDAAAPDTTAHNLLLTGGPLVGTMMPLGTAPIVIGRSPASTLVLDDEYASARHARLAPHGDQWWIEDLGSRNGTFVDDERITEPRELRPGTSVRIGQTTLELVR